MTKAAGLCALVALVAPVGGCRPATTARRAPVPPAIPTTDVGSFPSFWASHPHADVDTPCEPAHYEAIANAKLAGPYDRAAAWAQLATTCAIAWYDDARARPIPAGLRATIDFARALLDAGDPAACRNELASVVTPYAGGIDSYQASQASEDPGHEDATVAELADRAHQLDDACADALERHLADFRPAGCNAARTAHCYDLDADDGSDSSCGGVTWVAGDDAEPIALHASAGPLVDESFCCALDSVDVATRGNTRFLRIGGTGIARVCGGGTAARVLDAIYAVRGRRLELVVDYSIGLH